MMKFRRKAAVSQALRTRLTSFVFAGASTALAATTAYADADTSASCETVDGAGFAFVHTGDPGQKGRHGHTGQNGRTGGPGDNGAAVALCVSAQASSDTTLIRVISTGGAGGDGGTASRTGHHGGDGGRGGLGGDLTLILSEASSLASSGTGAHAIHLVSRGGDGGHAGGGGTASGADGGDGGNGGLITVTAKGGVSTSGDHADAIRIESIGGEGGDGANSGSLSSAGGAGGSGGFGGGHVTIDLAGDVQTGGIGSAGLHALSIGGDGGDGGAASGSSFAIGGTGGRGGHGGNVEIEVSGAIATTGRGADAIIAQSIGGGGGRGGLALAAGAYSALAIGGAGGAGGDGLAVTVALEDEAQILTQGDHAAGVRAQSIGGGGGSGGGAGGVAAGLVSVSVSVGGAGGKGGVGGAVDFTLDDEADVTTGGAFSDAVVLQSIGGGGGHGGAALSVAAGFNPDGVGVAVSHSFGGHGGDGGAGGSVSADILGDLTTFGDMAAGLRAQSIGGGGGAGGNTVSVAVAAGEVGASVSLSLGGKGGGGGHAGDLDLTIDGDISTQGQRAEGFIAQSVGGGGGAGGNAVSVAVSAGVTAYTAGVSVGGAGGHGGNAGDITLTQAGTISTQGDHASGGLVQAIGGGGGAGGNAYTFTLAAGAGEAEDGGQAETVNVAVGGKGGSGGAGGNIDYVQSGSIDTAGVQSHALVLQSIGGGGGTGGHALSVSANVVSGAAGGAEAKSRQSTLTLGGSGGHGDTGGDVSYQAQGGARLETSASLSHGLFVQSIGGGGGDGGYAESVSLSKETSGGQSGGDGGSATQRALNIGGSGGHGGHGGAIDIELDGSTAISTAGHGANALFAQSIGGGGGHGGHAHAYGKISGANEDDTTDSRQSVGGAGGSGNDGGDVAISDAGEGAGSLETSGDNAAGILAQSVGGGGGAAGTTSSALDFYGRDFAEMDIPAGGDGDSADEDEAEDLEGEDPPELQLIGGGDGAAGDGGAVTVTRINPVTTSGAGSVGIHAQSVGAGGGLLHHGGVSGALDGHHFRLGGSSGANGRGGAVQLNIAGPVTTGGVHAHAVLGQSIGGGGGSTALTATGGVAALHLHGRLGGDGGHGGGGAAGLSLYGMLQTSGAQAVAGAIQSIGGGGGDMRYGEVFARSADVTLRLGGVKHASGDAGVATLAGGGDFITGGDQSVGALVQSVGGGGGVVSLANFKLEEAFDATLNLGGEGHVFGDGGATSAQLIGDISTQGRQASALIAQSVGGGGVLQIGDISSDSAKFDLTLGASQAGSGHGGDVTVSYSGTLETAGDQAHGVIAQSVGGGGGLASITSGDTAAFTLGADAAQRGHGGDVSVSLDGAARTHGAQSFGVIAQSVGGGGGIINLADLSQSRIDQAYHGEGQGGAVSVALGAGSSVITDGDGAVGVVAQSTVGGGLLISPAAPDSSGAANRTGSGGGDVNVTAAGEIKTFGDAAAGLVAASSGGAEVLALSSGGLERHGLHGHSASGLVRVDVSGSIQTQGRGSHGVDVYAASNVEDGVEVDVSGEIAVAGEDAAAIRTTNLFFGSEDPDKVSKRVTTSIHIAEGGEVSSEASRSAIEIKDTIGRFELAVDGSVVSRDDASSHDSRAIRVYGEGAINISASGLVFGAIENTSNWSVDLSNAGILDGLVRGLNQYDLLAGARHYVPVGQGLTAPAIDVARIGEYAGELRPHLSSFDPIDSLVLVSSGETLPDDFLSSLISPAATTFSFELDETEVLITDASVDFSTLVSGASSSAAHNADDAVAAWMGGAEVDDGDADYYQQLLYAARLETADDVEDFFEGRFSYAESHRAGPYQHVSAVAHLNTVHSCGQPSGRWAAIAETECLWIKGASHFLEDDVAGARRNGYTLAAGRQIGLSPTLRLGFGAGYGVDLIKTAESRSEGEQVNLASVLKRVDGPSLYSASVALSYARADTVRAETTFGGAVELLASEQETIGLSGRLRAARLFQAGGFDIVPMIDLDASYLYAFGYDETGGTAALTVHETGQTLLDVHPAVRFGGDFEAASVVLRPYVALGARFALNDAEMTQSLSAGGVFSGRPVTYDVARDDVRATMDAGLHAFFGERWAASISVELEEGQDTRRESLAAKLAVRF